MSIHRLVPATLALLALPAVDARAANAERIQAGDPIHGRRLFAQHCGEAAARATLSSEQMASILDAQLQASFSQGQCVDSKQTFSPKSVDHLDAWDMVAFVRTRHLGLDDFFPDASRYLQKEYTVDDFGKERLKSALGRVPDQLSGTVFTFFVFDGEQGDLTYVPQDPILLDELKRDKKSGYLAFVPLDTGTFRGEVGVAFDVGGAITRVAVHGTAEGAEVLNGKLASFVGQGKLGRAQLLDGGKKASQVEKAVSEAYLLATELATMYVREERNRTWEP